MIEPEIRPRIIINSWVNGPVQLPERYFEHPLPPETYGIRVYNGGRLEIDILDKEVAIYSNSLPGDPVVRRLAAVLSFDDAKILLSKLPPIIRTRYTVIPPIIPNQSRNFNPDNYPPARVILEPDIVVSDLEPEEIEHPFPSGSEGLRFPLVIKGISPFSEEKIPMLILNRTEIINLYGQLQKTLKGSYFRGYKAVSIEKEHELSKRLVRYENSQFFPA